MHLVQIILNNKNVFDKKPAVSSRRNKNFCELIGSNRILNEWVVCSKQYWDKQFFCSSWYARGDNICCQQVRKTNSATSFQNEQIFKIFHKFHCKSCKTFSMLIKAKLFLTYGSIVIEKTIMQKNTILAYKRFQPFHYNL